jgi:hypothetical protein
VTGFGGRAVGL